MKITVPFTCAVIGACMTASLAQGSSGDVWTTTTTRDPGPQSHALASWYGPGFYGQHTASGAVLTHGMMNVAHRSMPFGTKLTFYYDGRKACAVVNDRGPYIHGREFDLGPGTAVALGFSAVQVVGWRYGCVRIIRVRATVCRAVRLAGQTRHVRRCAKHWPTRIIAPLHAPRFAWPVLTTDRRHAAQDSATAQNVTSLCESPAMIGGVLPDPEAAYTRDGGCGDRTRDLLLAKAQQPVRRRYADGGHPSTTAHSAAAAATRHRTPGEPTSETRDAGAQAWDETHTWTAQDIARVVRLAQKILSDTAALERAGRAWGRSEDTHQLRVRADQAAGQQRHVRAAVSHVRRAVGA